MTPRAIPAKVARLTPYSDRGPTTELWPPA